jgi:hypothetical protein
LPSRQGFIGSNTVFPLPGSTAGTPAKSHHHLDALQDFGDAVARPGPRADRAAILTIVGIKDGHGCSPLTFVVVVSSGLPPACLPRAAFVRCFVIGIVADVDAVPVGVVTLVVVPSEVAAVKPAKCPCEHQCHGQYAEPQDDHMPRLPQIELANAGHQYVSHNQIEHSPQDVDNRR